MPYEWNEMNSYVTCTKGIAAFLLKPRNLATHFENCEMLLIPARGTCIQRPMFPFSSRDWVSQLDCISHNHSATQHEKRRWKPAIKPSPEGRMGKQSMLITVPMGDGASIPKPNSSVPFSAKGDFRVFFPSIK